MDILKMIEKYNLSIRRIPDYVESKWWAYTDDGERYLVDKSYVPKNHGCYMVQPVNHNDNIIKWDSSHFISETLEGSLNLFLESLKEKEGE